MQGRAKSQDTFAMQLHCCFLAILTISHSSSAAAVAAPINSTEFGVPPPTPPGDFPCLPPSSRPGFPTFTGCREAVAEFLFHHNKVGEYTLVHRQHLLFPSEVPCPYVTRSINCEFIVDYERIGWFTPPASSRDIFEWGRRLAKACVGPRNGDGGKLNVSVTGLRGDWILMFEIRRNEEPVVLLGSNQTEGPGDMTAIEVA